MSVLLLNFEYFIQKNVWPLGKSLDLDSQCAQTLVDSPNSWCQKYQKVLLCRYFEGLSPLNFGY